MGGCRPHRKYPNDGVVTKELTEMKDRTSV